MSCRALSIPVALFVAGCETCPPDAHVIRSMRVLGATFDPPLAAPGGAVTVRAVTADVESRDVEVAWFRCASNLTLTPVANPDGMEDPTAAITAQVAACIARGEFARGTSVRVAIDATGGSLDAAPYRTARRWTDLVGFACADGSIETPPAGGAWPRCTGTRGVVFTASIPGPMADGTSAAPLPATLANFSLQQDGSARAWSEGDVPEVARCDGTRMTCPAWELRFDVADSLRVQELSLRGDGPLGKPGDDIAFLAYHVTGMAPGSDSICFLGGEDVTIQPATSMSPGTGRARLRWVPPAEEGEVTFWFTARRYSGGLSVARRTVRVR